MKTSERPSKLHPHLHLYALAASAAGVSMLALAQPSEAEIVYTPANVNIYSDDGRIETYPLDLTGDGTIDFSFRAFWSTTGGVDFGWLGVGPAQPGNAVVAATGKVSGAADLPSGHRIGPETKLWGSYSMLMASGHNSSEPFRWHCYGPWKNKQNRYLGLKFMINGEVHYGWAQLSESCIYGDNSADLTGYAYETIPNKAIKAGQETGDVDESLDGVGEPAPRSVPAPTAATLGMLAKGAQALSVWRP